MIDTTGTLSPLDQLTDDIVGRLSVDPSLKDITVLSYRKADIANELSKSLSIYTGNKIGVAIIVLPPTFGPAANMTTVKNGPLEANVTIRVVEDPTYNDSAQGFGLRVGEIALKVRQSLSMISLGGVCQLLREMSPFMIPADDPIAPVAYDLSYKTLTSSAYGLTLTPNPVITIGGGNVSISGAGGASLYYSTDGSYPVTAYTAPFAVGTLTVIRAVAITSGAVASDVVFKLT